MIFLAHRRKADAAVAQHGGGDAVKTGRGQLRIPRHLAVVVTVQVGKPRRDQRALRVDAAAGQARALAHRDDEAIFDAHCAGHRLAAATVYQQAARDL